jgi:drug/metabolite transporter (DMT)-like permease
MDFLLLLMVLIWGTNYSVLKRAFVEVPPEAFNSIRLAIASTVFLAAIEWIKRRGRRRPGELSPVFYTPHALTVRDRWDLVWLGLFGHFGYQVFFVNGVAITSVSNAAVIIGATPAVVTVVSSVLGLERIGKVHWAGAFMSLAGLYFVVGHGASFAADTLTGDLMVAASVGCWVAYTIGSGRLIARHSPLYVTGITMAIGGLPYAAITFPHVLGVDWSTVPLWIWPAVTLSALLAFNLSYVIWYVAVQRIGNARTSMYSSLVPIVAMAVAIVWLGEPVSAMRLFGASAVLGGVALTRLGRKPAPTPPVEE